MTAPDFRPYERKFKGTRHLSRARFLHSEEGEEWDEGSESEAGLCFDLAPPDSRRRKSTLSKTIYIDEVMERAHQ